MFLTYILFKSLGNILQLRIFRWSIPVVYRISVINKSKSNTTR